MIEGGALTALLNTFQSFAGNLSTLTDVQAAEHPLYKQIRANLKPKITIHEDGIAIIPIEGVLARKPDPFEMLLYGVEDSNNVLEMLQSAAGNPKIKAALLDIDSPGGFLTGGPEVADAVRALNQRKPTVAWTGGMMASLAYYIGSQAGQVVASRSAQVGSIGVYTTHVDYSKLLDAAGIKVEVIKNKEADYKAAGVMGTALTDEQRGHIQERIQTSFADFKAAVTRARPQVKNETMRGQVLYGKEAKASGLIDTVGDLLFALSILRSKIQTHK
jgi:signal peptide peptidase SppA